MQREELIQQIFDNMARMKRAMHGHFVHSFESLRLSPAQFELLNVVSCNEPLSHKQLAQKMQLTPGAISQLLAGLEDADCIVRTPAPDDRRVIYLSVSLTGKRMLEKLHAVRDQVFTNGFASLSNEELEVYARAQQKLATWLEANTPLTKSKES